MLLNVELHITLYVQSYLYPVIISVHFCVFVPRADGSESQADDGRCSDGQKEAFV